VASDLRAVIIAGGVTVVDVTPRLTAGNWSSAAMGGYASAQLTLPGIRVHQVPFLALLRLTRGPDVLFEGTVQDRTVQIDESGVSTTVQAFGLRQKLADVSLQRTWVKRDLAYQTPISIGNTTTPAAANNALAYHPTDWSPTAGAFDPSDLTRLGLAFVGDATASRVTTSVQIVQLPAAGVVSQILFDATESGHVNTVGAIRESADGATWTEVWSAKDTAKTSYSRAILPTSVMLQFIAHYDEVSVNSAGKVTFENIRLLGATTVEDATGGLYGGTVLRDVVGQVPELTLGVVEDGSDFTIQALDRSVRDTALSVVSEVAGYYTREWAVWEGGVFDWKSVDLDTAGYLLTIADTQSLQLEATVEGTPSRVIVQYQDVAGNQAEASASSTDQRNPLVKQGKQRDELVQVSFAMTNVTAAQLAARVAADHGSYPTASGRAVLSLLKPIRRANGGLVPAYVIRGGENIAITDLPKTDAFATGRDGETLFHVTDVEVDLDRQTVTLAFEGQIRRSDVLLARLGAATRVLTG
jgi:hypothetical protein